VSSTSKKMQSADICNGSKKWWPEDDMGNTAHAKSDVNIKSIIVSISYKHRHMQFSISTALQQ
jgi:hypothetical protein